MLLSSVPLLLVLLLSKGLEHALLGRRIALHVLVVPLQLLNLVASSQSLLCLELLDGTLTIEGCREEGLVTGELHLMSLLAKLLLRGVVSNEL